MAARRTDSGRAAAAEGRADVFRRAVEQAPEIAYEPSLQAVPRREGRDRIEAKPEVLLGSANIDAGCRRRFPNAARWDFVIGVAGERVCRAVFVEVHGADASGVSEVAKKLEWLKKTYLVLKGAERLASLPREFHWVASGRVRIPKNAPQIRRLAILRRDGLQGPTKRLVI